MCSIRVFQVDLKEIRDKKALPRDVYEHIGKKKLPLYQWTAIERGDEDEDEVFGLFI